jgi:hypothetical protein
MLYYSIIYLNSCLNIGSNLRPNYEISRLPSGILPSIIPPAIFFFNNRSYLLFYTTAITVTVAIDIIYIICAYEVLRTAYCVLLLLLRTATAYCVLRTAYCVLRTAYCVLRTAYCVLRTAYCVLLLLNFISTNKLSDSEATTATATATATATDNKILYFYIREYLRYIYFLYLFFLKIFIFLYTYIFLYAYIFKNFYTFIYFKNSHSSLNSLLSRTWTKNQILEVSCFST